MIKILRHGTKRTIECEDCGCLFSFEKEDITTEQAGINEYKHYIECPDCSCICDANNLF